MNRWWRRQPPLRRWPSPMQQARKQRDRQSSESRGAAMDYCSCESPISEVHFQSELYLPASSRRTGQFAERGSPDGQGGATGRWEEECRRVGQVEGFGAELNVDTFDRAEVLEEREIGIPGMRTPADAAGRIAEKNDRGAFRVRHGQGIGESRWVEVAIHSGIGE